jgi:2-polyprenyl-6-methoxyphenol hydroxylase-like FAD-dependent oxidoreductase
MKVLRSSLLFHLVKKSNSFTPTRTPLNTIRSLSTSTSALTSSSSSNNDDNNTTSNIKPVIIGGGISGLATALAFQNIVNIKTQLLLEKSTFADFQNNQKGAGAQIGPNGLKALKAIGGVELMEKCISSGSILKGNMISLPNGMMNIPDTAEDDTGLPQVFVRWGVLREMLFDALSQSQCLIQNEMGGDICGYKTNQDGTICLLTDKSVNSDSKESNSNDDVLDIGNDKNLIVAAEGLHSKFRYLVNNNKESINRNEDDSNIKDTGRINIKAIVPRDLDDTFTPNHTYAWFAPPQHGGIGCFAGPAGDGYTYWAISIADSINEETNETTPFLSNDVNHDDYMTIKSKLLMKLRGLDDTSKCQFAIDLIEESKPETIYVSRSQEAITIGPSLHTTDDKVVLVGDSAHAMSGSYGQNPNFALEDAAVLACCLRDCDTVGEALQSYSKKRVSRCLEMQHRNAERAAKAMKGEQTEDVSKWIFQWDVEQ